MGTRYCSRTFERFEVYRLGVDINDKHLETIARQMMHCVKIEDVGDTEFLVDEQVDKFRFLEENERVITAGGHPAQGRPLLGITKASLSLPSLALQGYHATMDPVDASYENASLKLEKALPLRAGERVTITVVRRPDPSRWDLARLTQTSRDDLPLVEAGLEDWVAALDRVVHG